MGVPAEAPLNPQFKFFAMDATGRLSTEAQHFIDHLCGLHTANLIPRRAIKHARQQLYMRLSVVCAQAVGTAIQAWRNRAAIVLGPGEYATMVPYPESDEDIEE